mmetsp:Transcript_2278/g.5084  ORF Transcript_2278/g.5084 Transcript_2278/m.5084 type:complete len:220 (+) Transcript_2278:289-948(+)
MPPTIPTKEPRTGTRVPQGTICTTFMAEEAFGSSGSAIQVMSVSRIQDITQITTGTIRTTPRLGPATAAVAAMVTEITLSSAAMMPRLRIRLRLRLRIRLRLRRPRCPRRRRCRRLPPRCIRRPRRRSSRPSRTPQRCPPPLHQCLPKRPRTIRAPRPYRCPLRSRLLSPRRSRRRFRPSWRTTGPSLLDTRRLKRTSTPGRSSRRGSPLRCTRRLSIS